MAHSGGDPAAIVFDLYGTLLDVSSVERGCASITSDPAALVALWRAKQLEYTWLRGLARRYVDFWAVTADALDYTLDRLGIDATLAERERLMALWLDLRPFPEVPAALATLAPRPLAVLSNGSPAMLEAALASAGLGGYFAHVLSVDAVRTYKPAPDVYALAERALALPAGRILFVSANAWDAAGAKAAGLRVCRLDRAGLPMDYLGATPDLEAADLVQLAAQLPPVTATSVSEVTSP